MGRRHTVDEETAAIATERLSQLLTELGPRRALDPLFSAPVPPPRRTAADDDEDEDEDLDSDVHAGLDAGPGAGVGADLGTEGADGPAPAVSRARAGAGRAVSVGSIDAARSLAAEARGFGRRHLAVLAVVLMIGVVAAGWALLRARPVAVATPIVVATTAQPTVASGSATPAADQGSEAAQILVHVLGAVRKPGVVSLPAGARVQDALDAAGGLTVDARPRELNLAQVVEDGQQVLIGTRHKPGGEVRNGSTASGSGTSESGSAGSGSAGSGSAGSGSAGSGAVVDLNTATLADLDTLPGVGPVTAASIIAWRTEHERFSKVEELQEVDGIGPKTYAQLAPHVRV